MLELTPVPQPKSEKQDQLIEAMAQKVHKYGMEVPAIFLGEMMKPASFALGQTMHAFGFIPATYGLSEDMMHQLGFILDDRQKLEKFLVRVEELAKQR
ncbi:MAG: hypothetical protein FD169_775 [Bacillota bacterium]|nr:MAG: hypothetical protein FD169_775 [Bacillota bacterium]MBS3951232.1 hypothetical protein [Peptococcaceae bacterium]